MKLYESSLQIQSCFYSGKKLPVSNGASKKYTGTETTGTTKQAVQFGRVRAQYGLILLFLIYKSGT